MIKKAERTFFEPFVRSVIGNARPASFFVALKLTVAGFFSLVLFSICFSHPATAFLFYGLSKQRKRSLMSECCESPWQGMCKKPRCEKRNNGDRACAEIKTLEQKSGRRSALGGLLTSALTGVEIA